MTERSDATALERLDLKTIKQMHAAADAVWNDGPLSISAGGSAHAHRGLLIAEVERLRAALAARREAPTPDDMTDDDWREIRVAVARTPAFAAHTRAEQDRLLLKIDALRASRRAPAEEKPTS